MKTILFIERTGTAHMYAKMTPYMHGVEIVHVAFSNKSINILQSYQIKPNYVYLELFKQEYDNCVVSDEILSRIDKIIIEQSNGRFNLNSAIQSDRGFSLLSYEESLRSVVAHFNVWQRIFSEHHVDMIAHEPCSLFFNFLGAILCKQQGGVYSYQIAALSDNYQYAYLNANNDDFEYLELKNLYKKYLQNRQLIDLERCTEFVEKFREEQEVFLGDIFNRKQSILKLLLQAMHNQLKLILQKNRYDRVYDNINYWISRRNVPWTKIRNLIGYKINKISFVEIIPEGEKYLFYPIHLEPEASVLYLGDGIYKNQIKLIENIAAALPPNYYLYVKDHPHEYAYRSVDDYKKLLNIPNIRLLNQWIPAKYIISRSAGVVTINGTAGFEAMLMGKQVYCLGHNMYSFMSRVHNVYHIRDLRSIIYDSINVKFSNDEDLIPWVMSYLESCHNGYVACYTGGPYIRDFDYEQNARQLAEDMVKYVEKIECLYS